LLYQRRNEMVGHKTQAIYNRYAIAEEKILGEAADRLKILKAADQRESTSKVLAE
jgi:hypothetical protein